MFLPNIGRNVLKLFALLSLLTSLVSCAFFEYVSHANSICEPGKYQVQFVEIATEVVRVKCATEGQLDVIKQDSTIQIIGVAYITQEPDQVE